MGEKQEVPREVIEQAMEQYKKHFAGRPVYAKWSFIRGRYSTDVKTGKVTDVEIEILL
jgi:hypothetical protein